MMHACVDESIAALWSSWLILVPCVAGWDVACDVRCLVSSSIVYSTPVLSLNYTTCMYHLINVGIYSNCPSTALSVAIFYFFYLDLLSTCHSCSLFQPITTVRHLPSIFIVQILVLAFICRAHHRRICVVTLLKALSPSCCARLHWLASAIRMKILVQTILDGHGDGAQWVYSFLEALLQKKMTLIIGVNFMSCDGTTVVAFVFYSVCWYFWRRCVASTIIKTGCVHRNDAEAQGFNLLLVKIKNKKNLLDTQRGMAEAFNVLFSQELMLSIHGLLVNHEY